MYEDDASADLPSGGEAGLENATGMSLCYRP